jgi:hypothetical protein
MNSQKSKLTLFLQFSIFLPELTGSTSFLSRLALLSQLLGKKMNFQKKKLTLFLQFSIFLPELTVSTSFLSIKGGILC